MLTAEEPKLQAEASNAQNDKESINIEKVKEEIEETKQEIEKLDTHKEDNEDKDEDIVIPPPPEFSVPLFTKYIHGRQRSISVSSELSLDSYVYEEGANSPNIDSSGESIINVDTESVVNTDIGTDINPPVHEHIDISKQTNEEEKDDDTIKDVPRDVQENIPIIKEEVIADAAEVAKVEDPKKEESKKNNTLTVETDEAHLGVNNHIPPPRSSASLSASVTRQEGIQDETKNEDI
eukprot:jgi/Orpsp1_1/1182482/evm.model.c7180000081454.1